MGKNMNLKTRYRFAIITTLLFVLVVVYNLASKDPSYLVIGISILFIILNTFTLKSIKKQTLIEKAKKANSKNNN